ncbi:MAG: hypothetical protein JKX97_07785 [Candidatus Lindowbacteria bacterium]|nr:hypothetical protein [Candidatus Lindowbacteria bacterium]
MIFHDKQIRSGFHFFLIFWGLLFSSTSAISKPETDKTILASLGKSEISDSSRQALRTLSEAAIATKRDKIDLDLFDLPRSLILTCSCPATSFNFDRLAKDPIVFRSLGGTANEVLLKEIEEAVERLGIENFLVLGHVRCRAIHYWLYQNDGGDSNVVEEMIESTHSHLTQTSDAGDSMSLYEMAVEINAALSAKAILERSECIRERAATGKTRIAIGMYKTATDRINYVNCRLYTIRSEVRAPSF